MDKNLLVETCKFKCSGGALIKAIETSNTIFKTSNGKILTTKAKCICVEPITCKFLTLAAGGTPVPCQINTLNWNNANLKIKINNNPILTIDSNIGCINGGIIKAIKPVKTKVSIVSEAIISDIYSKFHNEKFKENKSIDNYEEELTNESVKNREKFSEKNSEECSLYSVCNYESCKIKEECDYYNSKIFIDNDSKKLSNNFKKQRETDWNEYYNMHLQKNLESKEGNWRIAAHHIISGNQIMMMEDENKQLYYGILVKLANYFGYDINNALNCIMLPTNENNFGEKEDISKMANAYEVMWLMKRQWHVGGHQYTLSKETIKTLVKYYENHPDDYKLSNDPNFFYNYKNAMKAEMDKLLIKYSRPRCWKKNYEMWKNKFINDMNEISIKVEKYLLNFKNNPKDSFPFFVSKVAVEYAYNLPRARKLIVVYSGDDGSIYAKKLRVERYIKDNLKISIKDNGDILIKNTNEFIMFCENAMHFLIEDGINYELPFHMLGKESHLERKVKFDNGFTKDYLENHLNEIIAFVKQGDYTYQPINKVIEMRKKGAGESYG